MIRTAILGLGHWGVVHAWTLSRNRDYHLRYFCDPDQEPLDLLKQDYGYVNMVTSTEDVLKDVAVDLIVIAAPTRLHFQLTRQALLAGKHVFVEQPMAQSTEEARELVDLARKVNRMLFVGHVDEFNPGLGAMIRLRHQSSLGECLYTYSQRLNRGQVIAGSNPIWEFASHDAYILLRLVDRACLSVSAKGFPSHGLATQVVFMVMQLKGDVFAHFHLSWLNPSKVRQFTYVGEKKTVVFDDLKPDARLTVFDQEVALPDTNGRPRGFAETQMRLRIGDVQIPFLPSKEPMAEQAAALAACLKGEMEFPVPLDLAVEVVRILEAAQKSLDRNGQETGL